MNALPHSSLPTRPTLFQEWRARFSGLLLVALVVAPAMLFGAWVPVVGGAVSALLLGLGLGAAGIVRPHHQPGIKFAQGPILRASVVMLGFGLSLSQVAKTGLASLPLTLITLAIAFLTAWGLSRLLRLSGALPVLIGVGTAICGGSAIAATAPVIGARDHEIALSMTTIFLFNVAGVLLFPPLGHMLGLSDHGFGLWAGTAINDTSSVVAAGYQYSQAAGDLATVVKLTRASLIVPITLVLAMWLARRNRGASASASIRSTFPWFILGFVAAAAIGSTGLLPPMVLHGLKVVAQVFIVAALAGIGLSANLRQMIATGPRPILLGLGTWFAVAAGSLIAQQAMGLT
ncbi:MAG: YeiH family protein [Thermomonas sp.]